MSFVIISENKVCFLFCSDNGVTCIYITGITASAESDVWPQNQFPGDLHGRFSPLLALSCVSVINQMSYHVTKPTKWLVHPAKTDQPGHPPSLTNLCSCGKKVWVLNYP